MKNLLLIIITFSSTAIFAKSISCWNESNTEKVLELTTSERHAAKIIIHNVDSYDCNLANKDYANKVRLICFSEPRFEDFRVKYILDVPKVDLNNTVFSAVLYKAKDSNNDIQASTIIGTKQVLECGKD